MSAVRQVDFVEKLELPAVCIKSQSCACLADVDNDGLCELVVSSAEKLATSADTFTESQLSEEASLSRVMIFKAAELVAQTDRIGTVACIGVGDLLNCGVNLLLICCAEGDANLLEAVRENAGSSNNNSSINSNNNSNNNSSHMINSNSNSSSSNNNSSNSINNASGNAESTNNSNNNNSNNNNNNNNKSINNSNSQLRLQLRAGYKLCQNARFMLIADIDGDGQNELTIATSDRAVVAYRVTQAELQQLQRWELLSQIGSLSLHPDPTNNTSHVLVSQQGAAYVTLCIRQQQQEQQQQQQQQASEVVYHPVTAISSDRRPYSNTEIVGGVHRSRSDVTAPYMAMCTLDGTLMLLDGLSDKQIWSLQVTHQLFGLTKLDLTCDDAEEVILCSWDGMAYIVNHHKEVVKCQFPDSCQFFAVGHHGLHGRDAPVLLFGGFDGRLLMYTGVTLNEIPAYSLRHEVANDEKLQGQLERLKRRTGRSIADLVRLLLYEPAALNDPAFMMSQ